MSRIVLTLDTEQFSGGAEDLKQLAEGIQAFLNILHNASPDYCEAGNLLQRQLDEQLLAHSQELIDYCDEEHFETDWCVICNDVKKQFGLLNAEVIAIKVEQYIKYDVVSSTEYYITTADNFYSALDDILCAQDNKNGCQLYTDHFRITGSACFDAKTNEQVGFRITKVYFKKVEW